MSSIVSSLLRRRVGLFRDYFDPSVVAWSNGSKEADWLVLVKRHVVGEFNPAMIPVIIPVGHEETLKEQFHRDQTHNNFIPL